jgi:pyruvate formate-lyase activating enzyme-like uncharacterized protein
MEKTKFCSWKNKSLPEGCRLCVQGKKLVLFVTGLCPRNCFYCPLSDRKKNKDIVWANEWQIKSDKDIITEVELCESKGAGITGGDPLLRLKRTIKYIRMLKKRFGRKFHIHLYATLENVTEKALSQLYKAGLDEIRFHPDLFNKKIWKNALLAEKYSWLKGIEIPLLPNLEKQTTELIEYYKDHVDFFNLNELEFSDMNAQAMSKAGYGTKDNISYAAAGSQELGLKLLKKYPKLRMHFCTAQLKDKIQLANRIKRRAKNIATCFDIVTKEGALVKGAVYLDELKPGFGYRKKLSSIKNEKKIIAKLTELKKKLENEFGNKFAIDDFKLRITTDTKTIKLASKKYKNCAIVEEYPTHDATEIQLEFLS